MNEEEEETKIDIFTLLISAMNMAEENSSDGVRKKQLVLQTLKLSLGKGLFERYEPLLDIVIDGLVSIDKGDIKLAIRKVKQCFACF